MNDPTGPGGTSQPPSAPRQYVDREDVLAAFADAPRIDPEQWRVDLEAQVEADPAPRS